MTTDPRELEEAIGPMAHALMKERDYWKEMHDTQVVRKRDLHEHYERLRARESALRSALADLWKAYQEAKFTPLDRGNAPGHAHRAEGIWDDDNGEKAGTRCSWCSAWVAAREVLGD